MSPVMTMPAESLDEVRAERGRLRALIIGMSDAYDLMVRLAADDTRRIAAEAYAAGERAGYERGARLRESDATAIDPSEPTAAELEALRWGPGGREHYAGHRPTDRTGADLRAAAYASWGMDRAECLAKYPHLRGTEIPDAGEWS